VRSESAYRRWLHILAPQSTLALLKPANFRPIKPVPHDENCRKKRKENMQKYTLLTGADLKADNGSGRSLHRRLDRTIRCNATYVVGWNGITLDASTINYVEAASKISRRWLAKVAPELIRHLR
jgi:hypothetical protein